MHDSRNFAHGHEITTRLRDICTYAAAPSPSHVHPTPSSVTADDDMSSSSIHADPPPPVVCEPTGISYATGHALGKGGFAICHKAERYDGSKPTGQIVALKIVKTKMEPQKLAQKVHNHIHLNTRVPVANKRPPVRDGATNT